MAKRVITYSPKRITEKNFNTYEVNEEWQKLLGFPSENFTSVMYGLSRSGKSTFALKFAQYFSETFNKKTLYVAAEEGISQTLQERIKQNNITSNKIRFVLYRKVDEIEHAINRVRPRFIIIDSAQRCGLSLKELLRLKDGQGKKIRSWHIILQVNHNGKIDGKHKWIHETDIEINLKNGIAIADGRWGQGTMKVLDKLNQKQLTLF